MNLPWMDWLGGLAYALQPHCSLCGLPRLPGYPLCEGCHADLPWLPGADNRAVTDCDTCCSAFAYQSPIDRLLLGIKFGKHLRDLHTLGSLTATGILSQVDCLPQAILPIPLHPGRLQQRGFNQALELARPLARQAGIPLIKYAVVRQRATQAQTELDSRQRLRNLHQAFVVREPLPYRHIAVFDDVITTGATAGEVARLLRVHGVQRVDIWSCARTVLRRKDAAGSGIGYHYRS